MMISRSGDIFSKICRISYQHSTTDTNQVWHEIVRNLAQFKKISKDECSYQNPLRKTSTCNDLYKQEVVLSEFPLFLKGW